MVSRSKKKPLGVNRLPLKPMKCICCNYSPELFSYITFISLSPLTWMRQCLKERLREVPEYAEMQQNMMTSL